jgi:phenylpyruvate tautomerase PptA (4-oxalocrotonate tautomerase family)
MPLIRIDVLAGRSEAELTAISAAVHRSLTECFGVPERDRFQIITEHQRGRLIYDPGYLGITRTDGVVFVQVLFSSGRTPEQKKAFYARVVELLASEPRIRPEDVAIILVENDRADWSFGQGVAQYLVLPKEQWR